MKIAKYWARGTGSAQDPRGKWMKLDVWQWSDVSLVDAAQQAQNRVKALVDRVKSGERLNRYTYGEHPLREEVLQTLHDDQGRESGVITRNGYGAAVLNASNVMFVDIDLKEDGALQGLSARVQQLRGQTPPPTVEEQAVAKVEQWMARNVGLGMRVYRTRGGLRCLITNELFDPTAESTRQMLRELNSDPLYVRLCKDQSCFRARLSPKPWRCKLGTPPTRYPWENANAELRFRRWDEKYQVTSSRYAVCRLLKQIGNPEIRPEIESVLSIHDQLCRTNQDLPLA